MIEQGGVVFVVQRAVELHDISVRLLSLLWGKGASLAGPHSWRKEMSFDLISDQKTLFRRTITHRAKWWEEKTCSPRQKTVPFAMHHKEHIMSA